MERVTISAKAMEEDPSLWFPISSDEMKIGQELGSSNRLRR